MWGDNKNLLPLFNAQKCVKNNTKEQKTLQKVLTKQNECIKIKTQYKERGKKMEYKIYEHLSTVEDEKIKTYGIALVANDNEVLRVNDVSTDYNAVSEFVNSLNEIRINPFHLGEHVEMFINNN